MVKDWLLIIAFVTTAAALFLACIAPTLAVAHFAGPWAGIVAAGASLWGWRRFGPPPEPNSSFLSGILCVWGVFGIFAVIIALLASGIHGLLR